MSEKRVVIALGGNAINRKGEKGTIQEQFANTRQALTGVIHLIKEGFQVVLTHGNGPQVGNFLIRAEAGLEKDVPWRPLGVLVADTEGGMGYMLEQSLQNRLTKEGMDKEVVTILSQIIVDKDDPQMKDPTKPVGPFYTKEEAARKIETLGWQMKEDAGRGWRRVVPSPLPQRIVERNVIKSLVENNVIVITAGGGGIPVYQEEDGCLEGVDGVIDKDFASALLAEEIEAKTLVIATGVEKVAIHFGTERQEDLSELTVDQCKAYIKENQFAKGSMLPKIQAALRFLENGGKSVIITLPETISLALKGKTGTRIIA